MTPSAPEAHRTPPQSRPLLRVVENFRSAVDDGGRQPAPAPAPVDGSQSPGTHLLEALASADRRVDSLAVRIAAVQGDLRLAREALTEIESSLRGPSVLLRSGLVFLLPALLALAWASLTTLPQLTAIASAPYPPIAAAVAGVVDTVYERVAANQLLLTLFLPGSSLLIVFAAALLLRLKWRRGLAVSDR
jgi:hypothetical protein